MHASLLKNDFNHTLNEETDIINFFVDHLYGHVYLRMLGAVELP